MKTIVVAFDESEPAGRALTRAAEIAQAFGAQLVVTSVAVPPVPAPADALLPSAPAQLAADATQQFELADRHLERARALLEDRGVNAEFVGGAGAPADQIAALAEERDADLIVVGAGQHGFLERLFRGSVSDDVAHHTRRDVLLVH